MGYISYIDNGIYISMMAGDNEIMRFVKATSKLLFPGDFEDNAY